MHIERTRRVYWPMAMAMLLLVGACDSKDTDLDGLSDEEERQLGTAPHLEDTDGDGFTDFQEVVEFGFSPDNNNYKFNPLVADTPRVSIDLTSAPDIALRYTTSEGETVSQEVTRSSESRDTVTTSNSETNSHAVEYSESAGGEVTAGGSVGFPDIVSLGGSATVNYETSVSTTTETSVTWTEEQSRENARGLAETEALARTENTEILGGSLGITANVRNDGDIGFSLTNVAISAFMSTPGSQDRILSGIGQLSYDTTENSFPVFSYGPGQQNGPFNFENSELSTGTVQSLLADSTNLNVRVVAFELTDEEGRAFTQEMTTVAARTATVIIDYGDLPPFTERYQVATNVDASRLRVPLREALSSMLRIPYRTSADGALVEVRGLEENPDTSGYWTLVHVTTDGVQEMATVNSVSRGPYDFDAIELRSGDVLNLVYIEDVDGDGLGSRQEAAYGTDPNNPDSDGDGVLDGDEIYGQPRSNPLNRCDTGGQVQVPGLFAGFDEGRDPFDTGNFPPRDTGWKGHNFSGGVRVKRVANPDSPEPIASWYIHGNDVNVGQTGYFEAPYEWGGDWSCFYGGTISYDLSVHSNTGATVSYHYADDADVVIVGRDGVELRAEFIPDGELPIGTWSRPQVTIDSDTFQVFGNEDDARPAAVKIRDVLQNVQALRIRGEYFGDQDAGAIDNVEVLPADELQ